MFEDSDSNDVDETDITSSDSEGIMSDFDDDLYDSGTGAFMPDLLPNEEELSAEKLEKMTKKFCEVFAKRHPTSGLEFFTGSFDGALNQSIFNLTDPRPLIFYIRHNKSIADNIFCMNFFGSADIVNLLNGEFIIWPWDRTNMNNYRQFLKLLIEKLGSDIASKIASYSYEENQYPLLVCLSFENDQYTIVHIIKNDVPDEKMMFNILCDARDAFDHPSDQGSIINDNQNIQWHIPTSQLTSISRQSDQFEKIVNNLNMEKTKIIDIHAIENIIWSIQYSCEKRKMDDQNGHSQNEKELFYGCPLSIAQSILQNGFDYDGDKYGNGFCFSSKRDLCEKYTLSDKSTNDKKATIICRIIVDKNCPDEYNSNIFVAKRNEQILPEYLVIYDQ